MIINVPLLGISAAAWKKDSHWAKLYFRCPECKLIPHLPTPTEAVHDDLLYLDGCIDQWKRKQASQQAFVAPANPLPQLEPGPRTPRPTSLPVNRRPEKRRCGAPVAFSPSPIHGTRYRGLPGGRARRRQATTPSPVTM